MPTLTKELTKEQARRRTDKHKRDFKALHRGWAQLGKDVMKSIDLGVPAKLNMTARQWLFDTFPEKSASNLYRIMQDVRALEGVPQEKIEKIPESNAHELATRLPDEIRKKPDIIEKAIRQKPTAFKETVTKIREKLGVPSKGEEWKTYCFRVPASLYDLMAAAEQKLARILDVEISEDLCKSNFPKWTANRLAVAEAWTQLINGTDEIRLKIEVQGDVQKCPEEPRSIEQQPQN